MHQSSSLLRKGKVLVWGPALLPGAVERDAISCFGLRDAGLKPDDVQKCRSSRFVARKIGVCVYEWRGRARALLPHCGGLNRFCARGPTLRHRRHRAVVSSVFSAAGRQVRLHRARSEKRRDQWQEEQHQQGRGDDSTHEEPVNNEPI
jgi:hypothetical protein